MKIRVYFALLATAILPALSGCGPSNLHTVTGVVKMDGEEVEGAIVTFHPEDNTEKGGQVATGITNSSGKFRMGTAKSEDGVKPGKYRVTVFRPTEALVPTKGMAATMKEVYEQKGKENINKAAAQVRKDEIAAGKKLKPTPEDYNDAKKTPLTADVPSQTEYTFDLKTGGK